MHPIRAVAPELVDQLAETRFRRLYATYSRELLAFALRRVADPEDAADVLAETFLVAWRRGAEVPAGPAARAWLYGVARNVLANHQRGEHRRLRLAERLRSELAGVAVDPFPHGRERELIAALAALAPEDREILTLTAWEDLSPREAARALGISAVAARSRLHRARRRLRRQLDAGTDPAPDPRPALVKEDR